MPSQQIPVAASSPDKQFEGGSDDDDDNSLEDSDDEDQDSMESDDSNKSSCSSDGDRWNQKEEQEEEANSPGDDDSDDGYDDKPKKQQEKIEDLGPTIKLDYQALERYMKMKKLEGHDIELTDLRTEYQIRKVRVGFQLRFPILMSRIIDILLHRKEE